MSTVREIIDYDLLEEDSIFSLRKAVRAAINEGWQPFGSPVVVDSSRADSLFFAQAVIKYEPEIL